MVDNITSSEAKRVDRALALGTTNFAAKMKAAVEVLDDAVEAPAGVAAVALEKSAGVIPLASINLATQPTAADALTIGDTTFEFVAAAGSLAADGNVAVDRGANAAAAQTNLVAAINGTAPSPHPTIFKTNGTTKAKSRGAEKVFAWVASNVLYIVPADRPGGTPVAESPALDLSDTLTAAVAWSVASLAFPAGAVWDGSLSARLVVAAGAAARAYYLPFAPVDYSFTIRTAAGASMGGSTATVVVSGRIVTVTPGDAGATSVVAIDFRG